MLVLADDEISPSYAVRVCFSDSHTGIYKERLYFFKISYSFLEGKYQAINNYVQREYGQKYS